MALERTPATRIIGTEYAKTYRPSAEKVAEWYDVKSNKDSLGQIASAKGVSVLRLFDLNFPGSVENKKIIPEVVNWYLHNHKEFNCGETADKMNRRFKGGEKIAIPYRGDVTIEEPVIKVPEEPATIQDDLWFGAIAKYSMHVAVPGLDYFGGMMFNYGSAVRHTGEENYSTPAFSLRGKVGRAGVGVGGGLGVSLIIATGLKKATDLSGYRAVETDFNVSLGAKWARVLRVARMKVAFKIAHKMLKYKIGKLGLLSISPDDYAELVKIRAALSEAVDMNFGGDTPKIVIIDTPLSFGAELSVFRGELSIDSVTPLGSK